MYLSHCALPSDGRCKLVLLRMSIVSLCVCVCLFIYLTKREEVTSTVSLTLKSSTVYCGSLCQRCSLFQAQMACYKNLKLSQKIKKYLDFLSLLLFLFFICRIETTQPGTQCSVLMYSRVWKHKAAVYTVHKSNLAQTPLLHPALEPRTTVYRLLFFHKGKKNALVYADPGLIRNDV